MADNQVKIYDISGDSPVLGSVPPENVQDAIASGKFSFPKDAGDIPVVSPDGTLGSVPVEQAHLALNNGFTYATPDIQKQIKFSTPVEQAKTVAEGVAQGVAGPLAPLAETKLLGVDPEDIRNRAEVNPTEHAASQVAGFVAPAVLTAGASVPEELAAASLPGVVSKVGEAAQALTGLGGQGASTLSKIAATGIRTGAEMATIQGADELSKVVTEDPGQSLGSAAINIGLSGILGGAGGAVLGSVSPLWNKATNKLGISNLVDDMKGQYQYRMENPDLASGATNEISNRIAEVEDMQSKMGDLTGQSLSRAMPEVTPENTAKIDAQLNDINEALTSKIEKAADDVYLKGSVPKLAQHLEEFQDVATNPNASYMDKFDAVNNLKRSLYGLAKYDSSAEDSALGSLAKKVAFGLKENLEDSKVWGDAGNVQKDINKALSDSFSAQKDFVKKFTSPLMGEKQIDPNKVQTYLNQVSKSKAGLKTNIVQNYLDSTQNVADTINKIHLDAGLEAPLASQFNPTPIVNRTLNKVSNGARIADWLYDKGLGNIVGDSAAGAAGAGLGTLVGHPGWGALAGEKVLGPLFRSIAKPLMEKATNSEAAKATLDYASNVIKGQKLFNDATKNLFVSGAKVLPSELLPNATSRERLQKSLDSIEQNPNQLQSVGGNLGHYMPDHATAAAYTAQSAVNYLNSLKPKTVVNGMLDTPSSVDKMAEQRYKRAMDIAQQPLLILDYAKRGTLTAQDVTTLKNVYPGLYKSMVSKVGQELIEAKANGKSIPYSQRMSLSTLMGQPIDSTQTPQSMQAIMLANAPKMQQPQGGAKPHKSTNATLKAGEKVNSMYETALQARELDRKN